MNRRIASWVGAGTLFLLLVSGCSVGGQPQAAPAPASADTVTTTETATATQHVPTTITQSTTVEVPSSEPAFVPPAGFDDWGDRVGAKWSDQSAFTCPDSAESCWGVDLYSETGCAGGILVVLDVFRDTTKLTVIDSTTAAVTPGATVSTVLGQTGNGTGLNAKIADIRCFAA